jgi:predicted Rossmann-fold nucleotide-binding protein
VADQILDVDAPVPECAALLVRFGDLRLERDDSFESGYEVGHQAAPRDVYDGGFMGVMVGVTMGGASCGWKGESVRR